MTTADLAGAVTIAGRTVPRIGFGMGSLHRSAERPGGRDAAVALLEEAYGLGIRLFDTAHFYGDGLANDLLRATFGDRRDDVLIATKVGARSTPEGRFPMTAAQRPAELRDSVEVNLRTLGTDCLDLVYLRRMDAPPGLVAEGDQVVDLDAQLAELLALRDEGKLRGIGLSHVSLAQVERAFTIGVEVQAVQNIFNLLDRRDQPLLDLTERRGAAWVPYFPLGGGFHHAPRVTDDEVVRRVAADQDLTPAQVGQAWLLHHAPNAVLISGTSQAAHLAENVAVGEVRLDPREWAELDAVG